MVERSLSAAAEAMGGRVISASPPQRFQGAAIDSRKVQGGELFFALAGEHTDGHRFVSSALGKGAAAAVVHELPPEEATGALIRVTDTYEALHDLTRATREIIPEHLVAITGSVGKTTTKEILAALLASRYRVGHSQGNLNNLYGFPLSLLNIANDCEWMVAEMGMSVPGELAEISRLGRPDMAVFTNVRPVHLENFEGLRGIAEAKAELLAGLVEGGIVVANGDDPWVVGIARRHRGRVVFFGLGEGGRSGIDAEVKASQIRPLEGRPGSGFRLQAGGEAVDVELGLRGSYNVENFLAATAAAHSLGLSLQEIAATAAEIKAAPMRGQVHQLPGEVHLVDDAYNSNPDAAAKALASAKALPGRRYVAVLGDMLELGPDAKDYHRRLGEQAAALSFDLLLGVGPLSEETIRAADRVGVAGECFPDAATAAGWAGKALRPGDVWLVKGSRGIGLEAVVAELLQAAAAIGREEVG